MHFLIRLVDRVPMHVVPCWRAARRVFLIVIVLLIATVARAGTFVVFGPQKFVRSTGDPITVTGTFQVLNPADPFTLIVHNDGVTSAVISVNGQTIFVPGDFTGRNTATATLMRPVTLLAGSNRIAVQLRGQPGTSLTIEIAGIDNAPPNIAATASPSPNANGWNNTPVTVSFTCSDTDSGVATCPLPVTMSTEGANQVVSAMARDKAGNIGTASVTVNIDRTPPVLTATASPGPNANGWNNGPVTVTFTATDALSGVADNSVTPPMTLSADGTNLSATGRASDLAGNVAVVTRGATNIDQAKPTITVAFTPAPNANGWENVPITVHFTCTDTGSGIASCPSDRTISTEGAGQSITDSATDKAGNSATVTRPVLNLDRTPPLLTITSPTGGGALTSPIEITGSATDPISGVASVSCNGQSAVWDSSTFHCSPAADVGTNLFIVTATDAAGNTTSATITATLSPPGPTGGSRPQAQSYSLVSVAPSGPRTDDYTYRLLVHGDERSYRNAAFRVASTSASSQVIDDLIMIGDLDAGQTLLAPDTFTIRLDRLIPFDSSALHFTFSGQVVSEDTTGRRLSVGSLTFLATAGRPGHEGLFPLQDANPQGGVDLVIAAQIYGGVASATYTLLDAAGQPLGAAADLSPYPAGPTFAATVAVPSQPFYVFVSVTGTNSDSFVWQSRLYTSPNATIAIDPSKAVLAKGENIPLLIHITSGAQLGNYSVRLWLPTEFSSQDVGPWNVTVAAGETVTIRTSVTAPSNGRSFAGYRIIVDATPSDSAMATVSSSLYFEVE